MRFCTFFLFRAVCICRVPVIAAQATGFGKRGKIPLAQDFVNADGDAVGEVQAARFRNHGDAHAAVFVFEKQVFRQSGCLFAEEEVAIIGIVYIRVLMDGFCGEKEKFAAVFCKKFVERVIIGDVE